MNTEHTPATRPQFYPSGVYTFRHNTVRRSFSQDGEFYRNHVTHVEITMTNIHARPVCYVRSYSEVLTYDLGVEMSTGREMSSHFHVRAWDNWSLDMRSDAVGTFADLPHHIKADIMSVIGHRVIVYTGSACPMCRLTTRAMDAAGIIYTLHDATTDEAIRTRLCDAGMRSLPVVEINGQIEWSSHRPDLIRQLKERIFSGDVAPENEKEGNFK